MASDTSIITLSLVQQNVPTIDTFGGVTSRFLGCAHASINLVTCRRNDTER
jgi:hypothetical protein